MLPRRFLNFGVALSVLAGSAIGTASASTSYAPGFGPCIISAVVRDAGGRPVAGAVVEAIGPTTRSATTSAAGIATFNAVPSGRYELRATSASERSSVQTVSVTTAPGSTPASRAFQLVALQLQPESLAGSMQQRLATLVPLVLADAAPGFALAESSHVDAGGLGEAGNLRIDGGDRRSLRERLNGIPLPDALRGSLALAGAPALGTAFAVAGGTSLLGARPGPGTGGLLDISTRPLGYAGMAEGAIGSSDRGLIGSIAVDREAGPFAAGLRLGGSAGDVRSRDLDARVSLSPATELTGEIYRLDDADGLSAGPYAVTVRGASLATSFGGGRVSLQSYDSGFSFGDTPTEDRLHGIALRYDGTYGASGLDVSYTHDVESARYDDGTSAASAENRLALRSEYELSPAVRADVQYTYGRGTLIGNRQDVLTTIGFTLAPTFLLKFAAGSGVTPAPLDLVARGPLTLLHVPESAFEDSATLEHTAGSVTSSFEAFGTRERDRFAALSDARAAGVSFAYAKAPQTGFGFDFRTSIARVSTFGTATPERDPGSTELARELGFAGGNDDLAALRGHLGVSYRSRSGVEGSIGATYLDAPNALAPTALLLGDVSLRVPLSRGSAPFAMRLSGHDVLGGPAGTMTAFSAAAASRARRDLELTLERATNP